MNMNFEVFLQTLIKIAEHVYPNVQSYDALVDLVAQYFLPMYQEINNDSIQPLRFDPIIEEIFRELG